WSIVASSNPSTNANVLRGVSVVSANDVWAVGDFVTTTNIRRTLVEHWDGTAWSVVVSPNSGTSTTNNSLKGVSVMSANDVWAVGSAGSGTLVEHWNGTAWSVVASPNVA